MTRAIHFSENVGALLEIATAAAESGGRELLKLFGRSQELQTKSILADFRTAADTASEEAIFSVLAPFAENWNTYGEERGYVDRSSSYTVVVDPLDGTNNFVLGIPNFSVSVGLLYEGRAVLGVVHQPVLSITFAAAIGAGAAMNGSPIKVNEHSTVKGSTVAFGCGYGETTEKFIRLTRRCDELGTSRLMANWSPAYDLCLLASGKIEAVISDGLDLEDYVAGKVIVREAGGLVTSFAGDSSTDDNDNVFVASNASALHAEVASIATSMSARAD